MLPQAENELMCRVGPGTPMGNVLREYWLPVFFPSELTPDGPPLRTRLLGEDLIAFKDRAGRIALIQNACPHRGASLFFGRNEEGGLRCVYHGWKFDVAGQCVDMPSEPPESNFKSKVRAVIYPALERGGMVWVYMGRSDPPPSPPDFEWCLVNEDQRRIQWKAVRECNWVQALEGDLDSSHTGFLHSRLDRHTVLEMAGMRADNAPILEIEETAIGVMYGARRSLREDSYYWRTTQFVMPFYGMFPGGVDGNPCHIWVPIDDDTTLSWGISWNPLRPYTPQERDPTTIVAGGGASYAAPTSRAHGGWFTEANAGNDYLIDREVQRLETFSGIPTVALQDTAVTESMGTITPREKEHLGTSDSMIIRTRARLLGIAKAMRDTGQLPPGVNNPEMFTVRSAAAHLPRNANWREALSDWHAARGALPGMEIRIPT